MDKHYNPSDIEDKWYKDSLDKGYFAALPDKDKKPYTVVIPPPNVTGILHMGHALNNTIQDVQVRFKRMQGYSACWMPGTDHAGIATQNVVERKLAKEGRRKEDLGRDKFQEELWEWKKERGSTIINQLKKLGASCDWDRTRFTMDAQYSEAVREVFVHLYEKGLIYKGNRIVNWCPRCLTALSDEEAEHNESEGHLWHLRYPVVEKGTPDAPDYVVVATTRPETMLGDTGLAINPGDKRYGWLKKSKVMLPFMNRELTIIEDDLIDIEFGTGVVKVTPAHDPNDFDMGKRHGLEFINVMNDDAAMNENAGDFAGMDRYECREALVELMREKKLLEKIEPYKLNAGYCYRCHTVVEPRLSPQWFVHMKPLAEPAIAAVNEGKVKFTPERWTKVYLNWMENIQDWCISRQIWWGHRIPIWYCSACSTKQESSKIENRKWKMDEGSEGIYVSREDLTECPECGSTDIYQDPDVLDTWFSSWLWPFATFGWPFRQLDAESSKLKVTPEGPRTEDPEEQKADLDYFYPTDMLATASEILFFWVARMIMAGYEFMGDIPFSDVYIHGTVRDDKGVKMSKSLGNTIDPLEIIEKYGADALRFSLMLLCASGSDVYLNEEKFVVGRNFGNKLWNAARYLLSRVDLNRGSMDIASAELTLADKWILAECDRMIGNVAESLETHRINDALKDVYEFFWTKFCDWYIEITKVEKNEIKDSVLIYVMKTVLKLLHPFMPFITQEIYSMFVLDGAADPLVVSSWPGKKNYADSSCIQSFEMIQHLVVSIRGFKKDLNVNTKPAVALSGDNDKLELAGANADWICFLARLEKILFTAFRTESVETANADFKIFIEKKGIEGLDELRARLTKRISELNGFISSNEKKLANKNFVDRAPADIVNGVREMIEKNKTEAEQLKKIKI